MDDFEIIIYPDEESAVAALFGWADSGGRRHPHPSLWMPRWFIDMMNAIVEAHDVAKRTRADSFRECTGSRGDCPRCPS